MFKLQNNLIYNNFYNIQLVSKIIKYNIKVAYNKKKELRYKI